MASRIDNTPPKFTHEDAEEAPKVRRIVKISLRVKRKRPKKLQDVPRLFLRCPEKSQDAAQVAP